MMNDSEWVKAYEEKHGPLPPEEKEESEVAAEHADVNDLTTARLRYELTEARKSIANYKRWAQEATDKYKELLRLNKKLYDENKLLRGENEGINQTTAKYQRIY